MENLRKAVSLLKEDGIRIKKISSIYESAPWGYEEQEDFLNLALEVETDLSPLELLKLIKGIEERMGRKPTIRWGPRNIDIDILLYDDISFSHPSLTIPHPHLKERLFALLPLREIAPHILLTDGSSPFGDMEKLEKEQKVIKLPIKIN